MYFEVIDSKDLVLKEYVEDLEYFYVDDETLKCWLKDGDNLDNHIDDIVKEIKKKIQPVLKSSGYFVFVDELGMMGYKIVIKKRSLEVWKGGYDFVPKERII